MSLQINKSGKRHTVNGILPMISLKFIVLLIYCFIMPFHRFRGIKTLFCPLISFFWQKLVLDIFIALIKKTMLVVTMKQILCNNNCLALVLWIYFDLGKSLSFLSRFLFSKRTATFSSRRKYCNRNRLHSVFMSFVW
jgi:hypothetical protein